MVQSKPAHEVDQTTDRMMGLALQGQGELDMAFERFRRIPMHAALAQDMYWLAVDFERRQLFAKAQAVYQCIVAFDDSFKDAKERLARAGAMATTAGAGIPAENPEAAAHLSGKSQEAGTDELMLGRYQVVKELGKGAMGEVYLGKDPKIGRPVALKTMALGQEFDGMDLVEARARFFREAKAAGRLQHPSIVTIFDVGEANDLAFIAMEYIKGQDLQQHCKRAALMPIHQVVSIVARVAQALDYAHRLQVIHRDIKPSNVMYDGVTDSVKVTDFGIARITDGSKTRTGVVMGTPSYMSPEQLAGLPLDGRSDLYSLGIMLFQLLTGSLPFRAESMAQLMSKIATESAPDIRQLRSEITVDLASIVTRLLCKSAQDRYQDGEALAADLVRCSGRSQVGMTSPKSKPLSPQTGMRAGSIDLE
jgi:serine/threonine-protein kinase